MQCPYCNHKFPLTWGRYFSATTGRHKCPACLKQSGLRKSISYYLLLVAGECVLGIPLAILFAMKFGFNWLVPGFVIGALLSGIPFDKAVLDEKFRKLEKMEPGDGEA